jgi:uncharacterized protein YcbK (DUF882 family)
MGDLSANFSKAEFACHCGCGFDSVDSDLVNALQLLRDALNKPIHILSGCRCVTHNRKVRGKPHSYHLIGKAADIQINGISPIALYDFIDSNADVFGIGGIGLYTKQQFVHVDVRSGNKWRDKN